MNPGRRWTILFLILLTVRVAPTVSAADEPRTPAQELTSFHLADAALTIELIASEPDIVSPVAIAWDADGRMFVAEMLDYPNSPTNGQVKLLEDRDGDGRYERVTVFADKLPFPNGVLPWNGGVLITAAPNIWFMKDTDGDGRADEKRVVLTGFGEGNQQLRVNGLLWGLDNWVYGANGRSDGMIRRPDDPPSKAVSLAGHDFRFRPDTGEFELLAGRSQFGCARDDWGNRFLSWNTIPIRHEVIAERYLKRNPVLDASAGIADLLPPDDTGRVFPLTPPPLVFNNESPSYFNALAGLTIYRGEALGETYRGNAFMGEALRNLVHRRVLVPNGVTFVAERGEKDREFLASADPWFHPVNFATGPDGALYVVDFYRQFVEHPLYVHGEGVADKIAWRTGAEHGRIWRIRAKNKELSDRKPRLSQVSADELVEQLKVRNGWWADTAQRLLNERKGPGGIPELRKLLLFGTDPLSRVRALWTLDGMNALEKSQLLSAMLAPHPILSEQGIRVAEPRLKAERDLRQVIVKLATTRVTESERQRLRLILSLGELNDEALANLVWEILPGLNDSRWRSLALLSSAYDQPWSFFHYSDHSMLPASYGIPRRIDQALLGKLAEQIGMTESDRDVREFLNWLTKSLGDMPARSTTNVFGSGVKLFFLSEFARGCDRSEQSFAQRLNNPAEAWARHAKDLRSLIALAGELAVRDDKKSALAMGQEMDFGPSYISAKMRATAEDPKYRVVRLAAIHLLGEAEPAAAGGVLLRLLHDEDAPELKSAVLKSIAKLNDTAVSASVFGDWSNYAKAVKRQLLAESSRSSTLMTAFVDAVEQGRVPLADVDPDARLKLLKIQDAKLKPRIEKLFKEVASADREQVVKSFQPALQMKGDRRNGAAIFAKSCLLCHAVQGKGKHVGPDLSGVGTHPKETLLVDMLDPSRQVSSDYVSYTVVTTSGETVSGFITTESSNRVTLRTAGETDETFVRSQIKEIGPDGKSLMPDGLEQGLTHQDLADLLEFLRDPDGKLLPEEK